MATGTSRWLTWGLVLFATALKGQELYLQTLKFPPGGWDKAHGLAVNSTGEALLLGKIGQGWPLAVLVSPKGEPQWTVVTDGTGSLQRAVPLADGWGVAGAVDFWPYDYGGAFVARLDGAGNLLWQTGVTGGDEPVRLAPAPEEGYYLAFNRRFDFLLAGPGVARVSAFGELMWVRVLAMPFLRLTDLCSAPDGSLLVVGKALQDEQRYGFVSLWDPQGQPRWSFRLPQGTTLDACSLGPQGTWLLVGELESPGRLPDLWLATLHQEGRLEAQRRVLGTEGLWGDMAVAGSGWLVAVTQGTAYGEAVMLQLPWDLSRLSALAYHGGRGVWAAGVGAFADGTALLAGTDMSSLSSQLFMVKTTGRLGDFWECFGLSELPLPMIVVQEQLQPFSLAFSTEELYPVHWAVTPRWGDLPQREVRCVGRSSPVADLVLRGQASFDEALGAHAVVVGLRVSNEGEVPAPACSLEVSTGGGWLPGLPVGASCRWLDDESKVLCQLGTLPPGGERELEFVIQGSVVALRRGGATVRTTALEKSYRNNRVAFASLIPLPPRRVLRPRTPGAPVKP